MSVTAGHNTAYSKNILPMNSDSPQPPLAGPKAAAPAANAPASELDLLRKELADEKDLHLRHTADFENFKRRNRQEMDARAAGQKDSLIQELLAVVDNLERALNTGDAADVQQLHQGVEITLQQLRLLLRQHGVEVEESLGQVFDPHRHEALSQGHDPAQAEHAILQVFQRGYRKSGQVFRPAKVSVNKFVEHAPGHPKTVHHAR
jgi:molecular chaperone GrpE